MIDEARTLEHSGAPLALLKWGSAMKQLKAPTTVSSGVGALPVPPRLTGSSVTSDCPSRVITTVRTPSSLQARSVVRTGLGPCRGVLSTAGLGSTVLTMYLRLLMCPGPGSPRDVAGADESPRRSRG